MITANELITSVDFAIRNGNKRDHDAAWKRVKEAHDAKDISDYAKDVFKKRLNKAGLISLGKDD